MPLVVHIVWEYCYNNFLSNFDSDMEMWECVINKAQLSLHDYLVLIGCRISCHIVLIFVFCFFLNNERYQGFMFHSLAMP